MNEELVLVRKAVCEYLALIKATLYDVITNDNDLKMKIIENDNIKNRYEMLNMIDYNNERLMKTVELIRELLDDRNKIDVESTRVLIERLCGGGANELH